MRCERCAIRKFSNGRTQQRGSRRSTLRSTAGNRGANGHELKEYARTTMSYLSRWLTLARAGLATLILAGCSGVPLDDLKTSEFRIVRTSQKPIWAYSKCLAEHFAGLRG